MEDGNVGTAPISICSDLMCQEDSKDLDFINIEPENHRKVSLPALLKDESFPSETEEEKYIERLIAKEMSFCTGLYRYRACSSSSSSSCHDDDDDDDRSSVFVDDWFKSVRFDSVQWILRTSIYFGMDFHTSYLAVTYFDRFSLRRIIDKEKPWAARLLSIACLSLAAKMEEYRAPHLSEYPSDGCEFSADSIQRMELLVLSTLDWRMSCISPFEYIRFFASRLDHDHGSNGLMIRAVQCVLSSLAGSSVLDYRPSTVATAAILAASKNERLAKEVEAKINSFSLSGYIEKEHVYACYDAMNQGSERGLKAPKKRLASPLTKSSMHGHGHGYGHGHGTIEGSVVVLDMNIIKNTPSLSSNKRIRLHLPTIH